MRTKDYIKQVFRIILLLCSLTGLYLGLFPDKWYKLTFYTLQSNIFVFFFFLFIFFNGKKNFLRLKACVTINIALTFIVYAVLLAPKASPEDFFTFRNLLLHYIVPILCILDWFVFDEKEAYRITDPFLWAVFPIIYCIFALIKGGIFRIPIPDEVNSPYPYFFLNIDKYGWGDFLKYLVGILVIYILIGYGMILVKRKK